jgi:hypothetical protein
MSQKMMRVEQAAISEATAVRVTLWRAMHVQVDPPRMCLKTKLASSWSSRGACPAATLTQRYVAGRTDGIRPPNNSEELLVATT